MSDVILIHESPYSAGHYYRVDFVIHSLRKSGLAPILYACGPVSGEEKQAVGWEIKHSIYLRLLNFLAYLATFRQFPHFGFLLRMSHSLVGERPAAVVFYSHWTGLFLHFLRRFVGLRTRLIWEWYDLSTRMGHYRRRIQIVGKIMMRLEELTAPRYCDGLIVPTEFANRLLQKWGHPESKIHVLGEVRELNPFVSSKTIEKRIEDVRKNGLVQIVWAGVIRPYQVDGLTQFLQALSVAQSAKHKMVIHIVGPTESAAERLITLARELPPEISVQWHGRLSSDSLDRLLAQAQVAVHPLPDELFCGYIYSRKMADYLAASLPVAFSAVGGLKELGERFGVPFHLGDSQSVAEALGLLSNPDHYEKYLLQARNAAMQEYSHRELKRKGRSLVDFLRGVSESAKTFTSFRQDEAGAKIET